MVSFFLCIANILCIIVMGIAMFKIKEVYTPSKVDRKRKRKRKIEREREREKERERERDTNSQGHSFATRPTFGKTMYASQRPTRRPTTRPSS